jgi:glutamate dehydrogenase
MMAEIAELLRRLGLWFIVQVPQGPLTETIARYGTGFGALKGRFSGLVSPLESQAVEARIADFEKGGVPKDVAEDVAVLPLLAAVPEIVLLSEAQGVPAETAARFYFAVGEVVGLDRLRALAARIPLTDHWDRLALRRMVDDLFSAQRLLACDALARGKGQSEEAGVGSWAKLRAADIAQTASFLSELERGGEASIAKLALANSQIQKLAAQF